MVKTTENPTYKESSDTGEKTIPHQESPDRAYIYDYGSFQEIVEQGIQETVKRATAELTKQIEETFAKNNPEMAQTEVHRFVSENLVHERVQSFVRMSIEYPDPDYVVVFSPFWISEEAAARAIGGDFTREVNTNECRPDYRLAS